MNLSQDDTMELGQLLQFLDDWLATDHGPVNESLARFTFLPGESDGEGVFPPHPTGDPSDLAAQEPST